MSAGLTPGVTALTYKLVGIRTSSFNPGRPRTFVVRLRRPVVMDLARVRRQGREIVFVGEPPMESLGEGAAIDVRPSAEAMEITLAR